MRGQYESLKTRRSSGVNRFRTICGNLLLFSACLPGYIRFWSSARNVERCQTDKLLQLLDANRETEYGREHRFDMIRRWDDFRRLPVADYRDYRISVERIINGNKSVLTRDSVQVLQPTSGTSSEPKLIPYTASLAKEFRSALDTWIVDLFLQRPKLFLGSQYWSVSPATEPNIAQISKVAVGFLDDVEYFGKRRRWVVDGIMAVPSCVRHITDIKANQYVTLLFLLRAKDLRLISVWHPSFLTILLNIMRVEWTRLLNDLEKGSIDPMVNIPEKIRRNLEEQLRPAPARAGELKGYNPADSRLCRAIWPDLQVISCWRDGNVQVEIAELTKLFPDVLIQGKGLLATEGVVSIPMGPSQQHVCAITSHVIEFQDDNGEVLPAWDVKAGESYRVILTTAGGLYRYQLNDRVKVTGFYNKAPCLSFLGRAGIVSDCVGEKLHIEHVENIIGNITRQYLHEPRFAMLVPSTDDNVRRYNLLIETHDGTNLDIQAVAASLESELCSNYHYAHARKLGQLQPATVTLLRPDAQDRYRNIMINKGTLAGTVKFPALCTALGIEGRLIDV